MKNLTKSLIILPAFLLGLSACDVEKTQEGKMPDVDVDVKGGQMPKYDVDSGDIDVEMKEKTIKVPTLDYDSPKEDEAEEKAGKD